jgi:hypothetical protein
MEEHRSAHRLARKVHGLLEEARALEGISHCEFELGQSEDAIPHLRAAVKIYHHIGAAEATAAARRLACSENASDERDETP